MGGAGALLRPWALLLALAVLALAPPLSSAVLLRRGGQRACSASQGIFYDGFSRVACEVDASPLAVRIAFKEHACGGVASCRLTELPMTPRLCFDFCRTQESAKFFGLVHGRECYCATYYHAKSTGGQGECDRPCEGDNKEMCGGIEKSSLFEMHMCRDSLDEADSAQGRSAAAIHAAAEVQQQVDDTVDHLRRLALHYNLTFCSVAPEGPRVCGVRQAWLAAAAEMSSAAASLGHEAEVLDRTSVG